MECLPIVHKTPAFMPSPSKIKVESKKLGWGWYTWEARGPRWKIWGHPGFVMRHCLGELGEETNVFCWLWENSQCAGFGTWSKCSSGSQCGMPAQMEPAAGPPEALRLSSLRCWPAEQGSPSACLCYTWPSPDSWESHWSLSTSQATFSWGGAKAQKGEPSLPCLTDA